MRPSYDINLRLKKRDWFFTMAAYLALGGAFIGFLLWTAFHELLSNWQIDPFGEASWLIITVSMVLLLLALLFTGIFKLRVVGGTLALSEEYLIIQLPNERILIPYSRIDEVNLFEGNNCKNTRFRFDTPWEHYEIKLIDNQKYEELLNAVTLKMVNALQIKMNRW